MAPAEGVPSHHIDPIRCAKCDEIARFIRRTMDTFKRDGTEIWTFQCDNGHITEVTGQA